RRFVSDLDRKTDREEPYRIALCISAEDGRDAAWRANRTITTTESGRNIGTGAAGLREPGLLCKPLRSAVSLTQPAEILSSEFGVEEAVEESLRLRFLERKGPGANWPAGVGVSRRKPPDGASAYSRTHVDEGIAHSEELRPARGEGQPYVLQAD